MAVYVIKFVTVIDSQYIHIIGLEI